MFDFLQGKKTVIAAFLLALYAFLKGMGWMSIELPAGWEEGLLAVVFFALRLITKTPVAPIKPSV